MKILIVTTYGFDPAFPSRPEQLQARALVRRGHRVAAHEYLDRRYPGQSRRAELLDGGVPVRRSATLGFFAPEALLRLLASERPDIIHLHHLRSLLGYQTVLAARALGIPTVLTVHGLLHDGDLVADRERPLEAPLRFDNLLLTPGALLRRVARGAHPRRAARNYLIHAPLRWVDSAVALSRHEAGLLTQLGLRPEQIAILPNAVDLSSFAAPAGPPATDARPPFVLFIGQLVPRKGFDLLARAMPAVAAACSEARLVMVSHNRAGEAELTRLLEEGGVRDRVELRGRVSEEEKVRLLREAAVVVAPSRYEGFGIPIIEALAAGAPLVTTDAPAGNELVEHGRTALLTPYGDAPALAAAVVRLLQDRPFARSLGEAGRGEVLGRYDADTLAAGLEALYQKLLAQHAP